MNDAANPYRPPQSEVGDVGDDALETTPASRTRRFLNFVIDYVCFLVLAALLGAVGAIVWGMDAVNRTLESAPDFVWGLIIFLLYYIPLEGMFGRTVGKLITGTRVVDEYGRPPSWGQVIGRTFARFIPFEMFTFFNSAGRGMHDKLARTYVVRYR